MDSGMIDFDSVTLRSDIELQSGRIICTEQTSILDYDVVVENNGKHYIDYTSLSDYVRASGYVKGTFNEVTSFFTLYKFDRTKGYYRELSEGRFMYDLIILIKSNYPQLRQMPTQFKTHINLDIVPFIPTIDEIEKTEEYLTLEILYTDGEVIPFKNGFYSLRYNRFLPRTSCKFIQNPLNVEFNPDALKNDIGERYMQMMDDEISFEYLFQQLGYAMYASAFVYPTYTLLYGGGANGKSIIIDAISRIVGVQNISRISLEDMTNQYIVAESENKMLNLVADAGSGYRDSAFRSISAVPAFMKTASAGEPWTFNPKHKQPHQGIAPSKFIFASNNYLNLGDSSDATNRRMHAVPFNRTFEEDYALILRFRGAEETEWFAMQALISFKNMIHNAMKGDENIPFAPIKGKYIECDVGSDTKIEMMVNNNIVDDYISNVLEIDILNKEAVRDGLDGMENVYADLKSYCDEIGRKAVSQTRMTQYLKAKFDLKNARTSYIDKNEVCYKYVIRKN